MNRIYADLEHVYNFHVLISILTASETLSQHSKTFQRCFKVVFKLMLRRDVGQRQINVETTLCISTFEFTTSKNVESNCVFKTLI